MTNWYCAGAIASSAVLFCANSTLAERYIWLAGLDLTERMTPESVILEALRAETARTTEPFRESVEEQRYIDRIVKDKVRQLFLLEEGSSRPMVDLEVYFAHKSSVISPQAEPELMKLGRALTDPDLERDTFLIAAHTDANGTSEELRELSERRARAVKEFLKQRFKISDERLVAAGYGKELLKNSDDPFAQENQRIQVINLSSKYRECKRTPSAAPSCE